MMMTRLKRASFVVFDSNFDVRVGDQRGLEVANDPTAHEMVQVMNRDWNLLIQGHGIRNRHV